MWRLFGELLDNPFPNNCQYWKAFWGVAPFAFDQR